MAQYVGAFLGLILNTHVTYATEFQTTPDSKIVARVWLDDFCDDTPQYKRWFDLPRYGGIVPTTKDGSTLTRYTVTPPYMVYNSSNIMEFNGSPSYLTQDQVKRMQWVLENAPGRQMWRDTWAID